MQHHLAELVTGLVPTLVRVMLALAIDVMSEQLRSKVK